MEDYMAMGNCLCPLMVCIQIFNNLIFFRKFLLLWKTRPNKLKYPIIMAHLYQFSIFLDFDVYSGFMPLGKKMRIQSMIFWVWAGCLYSTTFSWNGAVLINLDQQLETMGPVTSFPLYQALNPFASRRTGVAPWGLNESAWLGNCFLLQERNWATVQSHEECISCFALRIISSVNKPTRNNLKGKKVRTVGVFLLWAKHLIFS